MSLQIWSLFWKTLAILYSLKNSGYLKCTSELSVRRAISKISCIVLYNVSVITSAFHIAFYIKKTRELLMIGETRAQFIHLAGIMSGTGSRQQAKVERASRCFVWCRILKYLKGKVYKTVVRLVLMYGAETWTVIRREEGVLETAWCSGGCWWWLSGGIG